MALFATLGLVFGKLSEAGIASLPPSVWAIDDGEKIGRLEINTGFEHGLDNPVWQPGGPVRLFALREESVAIQVVVEAGDARLPSVTVDFGGLVGPNGARLENAAGASARTAVGRPIELFVEHFVYVRRASGGRTAHESLGWEAGSGPPRGAWEGAIPDALVPIELAASWAPYPMRIEPRTNGVVWIDINVPSDQPAGMYRGIIQASDGPRALASLPVELTVDAARLAYASGRALAYYDREQLDKRVGDDAEESLWRLLHAHRVSALHDATAAEDIRRQAAAIDGTAYTVSHGYMGPGANTGDGVVSVGAYGTMGEPSAESEERVHAIAAALGAIATHAVGKVGATDAFLYADDEDCASPRAALWRTFLRGSNDPDIRAIRVGWTCSERLAGQPVDIAMLLGAFDVGEARKARSRGTDVWVYNGVLPRTGTFLLDADAVSPRVNGWLAAMFGIPRWFYWDVAHWYDTHGTRPLDPFREPESLHNKDGDWANGDGVLVYPGRQNDVPAGRSLGFAGVVPSIRLKNWRRGLEDGIYLELARTRDSDAANHVAQALIPRAFGDSVAGAPPSWSVHGRPFFEARRKLFAILTDRRRDAPEVQTEGASSSGSRVLYAIPVAMAVALVSWTLRRKQGITDSEH
jgi:hypothetical protein